MDKDLDYFKEFLEDPSAPTLGEFYRMLRDWCEYLQEHKNDFNYIKDEEWQEIRHRLNNEFRIREAEKAKVEDEWEYLNDLTEDCESLSDEELIDVLRRKLVLMKTQPDFFDFEDEVIVEVETSISELEKAKAEALNATEKLLISEQNLDRTLAHLDEEMMKIEAKTGKTPRIQFYRGIKRHKGN